jgi:hypothetical protein
MAAALVIAPARIAVASHIHGGRAYGLVSPRTSRGADVIGRLANAHEHIHTVTCTESGELERLWGAARHTAEADDVATRRAGASHPRIDPAVMTFVRCSAAGDLTPGRRRRATARTTRRRARLRRVWIAVLGGAETVVATEPTPGTAATSSLTSGRVLITTRCAAHAQAGGIWKRVVNVLSGGIVTAVANLQALLVAAGSACGLLSWGIRRWRGGTRQATPNAQRGTTDLGGQSGFGTATFDDNPQLPFATLHLEVSSDSSFTLYENAKGQPYPTPFLPSVRGGTLGAGAGSTPFFITDGKAYLIGPYKGAPFGTIIVVPAVAGPFDLGTVVVRAAAFVDTHDATMRIVSDPFPTILQGIPLSVRDIRVDADTPGFFLNATSCTHQTPDDRAESESGIRAGHAAGDDQRAVEHVDAAAVRPVARERVLRQERACPSRPDGRAARRGRLRPDPGCAGQIVLAQADRGGFRSHARRADRPAAA